MEISHKIKIQYSQISSSQLGNIDAESGFLSSLQDLQNKLDKSFCIAVYAAVAVPKAYLDSALITSGLGCFFSDAPQSRWRLAQQKPAGAATSLNEDATDIKSMEPEHPRLSGGAAE